MYSLQILILTRCLLVPLFNSPQPRVRPAVPPWLATTAPSATSLTTNRGATSTTAPSATSAARCAAPRAAAAALRGKSCCAAATRCSAARHCVPWQSCCLWLLWSCPLSCNSCLQLRCCCPPALGAGSIWPGGRPFHCPCPSRRPCLDPVQCLFFAYVSDVCLLLLPRVACCRAGAWGWTPSTACRAMRACLWSCSTSTAAVSLLLLPRN